MARFWISRPGLVAEEFDLEVSASTWERHARLLSNAPRFEFWARETGDERFTGAFAAMIVEPA